jgi:hypothetical protein
MLLVLFPLYVGLKKWIFQKDNFGEKNIFTRGRERSSVGLFQPKQSPANK